jgi:hypothetical protein
MKDKFPDTIQLEDAGMRGESRTFRLTRRFRYLDLEVPAGFVTDGASVPRIFWSILYPFGSYFPAALIHDYLYSKASDHLTAVKKIYRKEADLIFLQAMKDVGVGWLTRRTIYRAVRIGGWKGYKKTPIGMDMKI